MIAKHYDFSKTMAIFSLKVNAKVTRLLTLASFERISLVESKVSIFYGSKSIANLGFFLPQTDRHTHTQDNNLMPLI